MITREAKIQVVIAPCIVLMATGLLLEASFTPHTEPLLCSKVLFLDSTTFINKDVQRVNDWKTLQDFAHQ